MKYKINLLRSDGNEIGKEVYISSKNIFAFNSELKYNIKIGDRVSIAQGCKFITSSGPNDSKLKDIQVIKKYIKSSPISIGNDTWIGTNTIVHPGINIGKRCIIGAMSNVTRDIPDDSMAVGNPCKVIKSFKFENNDSKS